MEYTKNYYFTITSCDHIKPREQTNTRRYYSAVLIPYTYSPFWSQDIKKSTPWFYR